MFEVVRDKKSNNGNTTPSKTAKYMVALFDCMEACLELVPNTKLPKTTSESALIQLNGVPGRRWAFEHRRLCDVASDLNGWVMLLLAKI